MIKYNEFCDYDICKLLYENDYREGSDWCITQYTEDYIYDDDPDHTESHLKGEIEVFNFYQKNNDKDEELYEMPTIYEVQKWLRDKHKINTYPIYDNLCNKWSYEVTEIGQNKINNSYRPSIEKWCDNAEDAIKSAILYSLELINN